MLYVTDDHPLWLMWFLNAENTCVSALRSALRVVPPELWASVHREIDRGLSELSTNDDDGAEATFPIPRNPTLEMKSALLAQEGRRRGAS